MPDLPSLREVIVVTFLSNRKVDFPNRLVADDKPDAMSGALLTIHLALAIAQIERSVSLTEPAHPDFGMGGFHCEERLSICLVTTQWFLPSLRVR